MRYFFFVFFTISGLILNVSYCFSQLSNEYIANYQEKYSDSQIQVSLVVSSKGKAYGYRYNIADTLLAIHYGPKAPLKLKGDQILQLTDNEVFYQYQQKAFRRSLSRSSKPEVLNHHKVKRVVQGERHLAILYESNELELFVEGRKEACLKVDRFWSGKVDANGGVNVSISIFAMPDQSVLIGKFGYQILKDSIQHVVPGITNAFIVGTKACYTYRVSDGALNTHPASINEALLAFVKPRGVSFYRDHLISFNQRDTVMASSYFLTGQLLDPSVFFKLARSYGAITSEIFQTKVLSLQDGEQKLVDYPSKSVSFHTHHNFTYNSHYYLDMHGEFPAARPIVQNIIYNKTVRLDSLCKDYTGHYVTPDGEYVFLSTLDKKVYRYQFSSAELKLIVNHFPFMVANFEYATDRNEFIVSSYDTESGALTLNTGSVPYVLYRDGKVDSLDYSELKWGKFVVNHLQDISGRRFIYSRDRKSGISKLFLYEDGNLHKLSDNENFKFGEHLLYRGMEQYGGVFLRSSGRQVYWSESNLKTGHAYHAFDSDNKIRRRMAVDAIGLHDTLEYRYESVEHNNRLITGAFKFPKGYDPSERYPVIISLYLGRTNNLHFASNGASIENKASNAMLNELNLLHQGYIICYIDIPIVDHIYSSNSADVNTYIREVFPRIAALDMGRIGIFGHSRSAGQAFGALVDENCLIKCAVISNGMTSELIDLTTFSNPAVNYPFDNTLERYSRFLRRYAEPNSTINVFNELKMNFETVNKLDPFNKLGKLKAAILFNFNDNDGSINSSNGYFAYIKSRLLGKNTYLINFLKEGHNIVDEKNTEELYKHVVGYLNFYLKTDNRPDAIWNEEQVSL